MHHETVSRHHAPSFEPMTCIPGEPDGKHITHTFQDTAKDPTIGSGKC